MRNRSDLWKRKRLLGHHQALHRVKRQLQQVRGSQAQMAAGQLAAEVLHIGKPLVGGGTMDKVSGSQL